VTARKRTAWNSTLGARKAPMKRSRLKAVARLAAVGRRGKRMRAKGELFGPLAVMVRRLNCDVCGSPGPSDPHHVRSRGAGFKDWLPNGDGNLVALCRRDHQGVHAGRGPPRDVLLERARGHGEFFKTLGVDDAA